MNVLAVRRLLVIAESCLIIAAVWLAAYIRLSSWMWEVMVDEDGMWKAVLIAAVCQLCLYYSICTISGGSPIARIARPHHPGVGRSLIIWPLSITGFPAAMDRRGRLLSGCRIRNSVRVRWRSASNGCRTVSVRRSGYARGH